MTPVVPSIGGKKHRDDDDDDGVITFAHFREILPVVTKNRQWQKCIPMDGDKKTNKVPGT